MGRQLPHLEENHRQGAHRAALQPNPHILPVSQTGIHVDVFIRRVDAAGISHLSVDDHDFLMVAVVEIKAGDKPMRRAEYRCLNPFVPESLIVIVGDFEKTAHIVVEYANLHPLGGFAPQNIVKAGPQLPLRHNKIFH